MEQAVEKMGVSCADLRKATTDGVEAAFLGEEIREDLLRRIDDWWAEKGY